MTIHTGDCIEVMASLEAEVEVLRERLAAMQRRAEAAEADMQYAEDQLAELKSQR